ncbi:hypothetical protein [Streptomyces cucumeris]|uniref:hypothetical protein n=1 Tax=Streptomyces cucumeris TaxID=2962890 RepID=UPI0020C8983D|nr:hypothetical protein [Streptomyces sp. NEAU-Y11]MCP9212392.1 hypothetical protein [Streptomyces sp. NEAU-Y11]
MAPTGTDLYYRTYTCTGCESQVDGVGGRWACTSCGTTSPYTPPPEGWQSELDEHVGRDGYVGTT